MKILLVNKFHWIKGGSETYYFGLGNMLKNHGHEIAYFSMEDEKNIDSGDIEYFVEASDMNSNNVTKAFDVIYNCKNKIKMEKALDEFKPDIVHINNFQRQLSASIIFPCVKRNIPVVFTAHDTQAVCPAITMMDKNGNVCDNCLKGKYTNCIKNKCIKNSRLKSLLGAIEGYYYRWNKVYVDKIDCIITPSDFLRKILISDGIPSNKIKTLHNFVSVDNKDDNIKIGDYALYVGRLSKEKGILNLLKAFQNVKGKLYVAGDGPEMENIKEFIKNNKMESKVKLLGFLNKNDVIEYVKKCRFVVLPSICNENCPYSILEAITFGKPVLASNVGGVPELVVNDENGIIYDYNDIKELSNKLDLLFKEQHIIEKYSLNSKEMSKLYTIDNYYENIMEIYNSLINK
mgnify:CR=1 FL=1